MYTDGPAAALLWGDFFTCKVRGWREFLKGSGSVGRLEARGLGNPGEEVSEKWKLRFSGGPGLPTLLRDTGAVGRRRTPYVTPGRWCGLGFRTP